MKNIYVPIDFSDVTNAVVEQAVGLAQAFDARVRLVHVAPLAPEPIGSGHDESGGRDPLADEPSRADRQVQAVADRMRDRLVTVKALCIEGPVVATIVSDAERWGADVIVLGSHGHGGAGRSMLGSVSEGVVRDAPCPIYVVPWEPSTTRSASPGNPMWTGRGG